jgi:hypothetical protein
VGDGRAEEQKDGKLCVSERRNGERSRMGSSMDRMGSSKNRTGCRMRSRRDRIMRRSKWVINVNEG